VLLFVVSSLAKGIAAMSSATDQRVDCFSVFSAADPSALLRILEAVSLLGVLPSRCHSAPLETDPGQLVVDLQIAGCPQSAQLLAKRLERVITVTQVLHSQKHCAAA
jgi:acetolactate synthase regulatory subunit